MVVFELHESHKRSKICRELISNPILGADVTYIGDRETMSSPVEDLWILNSHPHRYPRVIIHGPGGDYRSPLLFPGHDVMRRLFREQRKK